MEVQIRKVARKQAEAEAKAREELDDKISELEARIEKLEAETK